MSRTTSIEVPSTQATGITRKVTIKGDVLDDISSRFLINLSSDERADPIKLCSHIEVAHWYYLDLMRPEDHTLPACNLKEFMATVFQHCPWLVRGVSDSSKDLDLLISDWKTHKYKKPLRGAILLNQDWTKCLLVQGYPSGTSWTFPKGKLEEGETDKDAAVREVFEETGFDIRVLIQKSSYLDAVVHDSNARMYIIPGVPDNTHFEAKTRKEIKNIKWFEIKDLPSYKKDQTALGVKTSSFFMVIPFIGQLRRWIQKKKGRAVSASFKIRSQVQESPGTSTVPVIATPSAVPVVSSTNKSLPVSMSVPVVTAKPAARVSKVPLLGDRPGSGGGGGPMSLPSSNSVASILSLSQQQKQQQLQQQQQQHYRGPAPPAAFQGQAAMPGSGSILPHQPKLASNSSFTAAAHHPMPPPPQHSSFNATPRPGAISHSPGAMLSSPGGMLGSPGAMLSSPSNFQQQQVHFKGALPLSQGLRPQQHAQSSMNFLQQQQQQQAHFKGALSLSQGLRPQQQQQQQHAQSMNFLQQQQQQQALHQVQTPRQSVPSLQAPRLPPEDVQYLQQQQLQQAPPLPPPPRLPSPVDILRLPHSHLPQNPPPHQQQLRQAWPLPNNSSGASNLQLLQNYQQQQQFVRPVSSMLGVKPNNGTQQNAPVPGLSQSVGVAMQQPSNQPVGMAMQQPPTQMRPLHFPHGHPAPATPLSQQPHSHGAPRPTVPKSPYQTSSGRAPLLPNPSGVSSEARPRIHTLNTSQSTVQRPQFQPTIPRGPKAPLLPSPPSSAIQQGHRPNIQFAIKPSPDFMNFRFNQQDILKNLRA